MAAGLEALHQEYMDRGFIAISLMGENTSGGTPTPEDLQEWAATYGITHPLVADAGWAYSSKYFTGGIPSETLMAPGAVLKVIDGFGLEGPDFEEYLPK